MDLDYQCTECFNSLGVFPIYSYGLGTHVCGRCKVDELKEPQRQYVYEAIALFIQFKCCYHRNGCSDELTPGELPAHEKSCLFKKFTCIPSCEWIGFADEILSHFREEHPELEYKETAHQLIDLTVQQSQFVFQAMDRVFMLYVKPVNRKLLGIITFIGPEKEANEYVFELSLKDEVASEKLQVQPQTEELNFDTAFHLDVGDYESVRLQASVMRKVIDSPLSRKSVNASILKKMECTVCFDLLLPPIWQCCNGHCLCSNCRSSCKQCPTCKVDGVNIRSLILEQICEDFNYPCQFRECQEILTGPNAKKIHEESCKYARYKCPFCDDELIYSLLVWHVFESHAEYIPFNEDIIICVATDILKTTFLLLRYECLFLFTHTYSERSVLIDVQLYAPRVDNTFDYIVTVKKEDYNAKLMLRQPCSSWSEARPIVINESVLSVVNENIDIIYYINIVKNDENVMNFGQLLDMQRLL